MNTVDLGPAVVGVDSPPFIVAEVGSIHNGDMDLCRDIIDAAVEAGADAVKFQSWTESTLFAEEVYQENPDLREDVREYQFTPDEHRTVHEYCRDRGITFCSSVFSEQEVDLLEELDVPFYKIASMDINNLPLLDYVARKGRPMIVSTGMATMAEIEQAIHTIQAAGNDEIVLLHCVSVYPPDMDLMNLRNMETLQTAFDVPVGFSDHTLGTSIPLAAIARGACVVEKHFTIDKDLPGWDHAISANPEELETLVEEGNRIHRALGSTVRTVSQAELDKRVQFRRSAIAQKPLEAGEVLTRENVAFKRPGSGISPDEFGYAEGQEVTGTVKEGHVIHWHHLDGGSHEE